MQPATGRPVLIGRIVGLFGVDGWVKIESFTEPRERILKYRPWRVRSGGRETEIAQVVGRTQGKGVVAKLPQIDDRDAAVAWVGAEIFVDRSSLPKARRGEYYWIDLEGLEVENADGVRFGTVSHLFSTGANDVMVVRDGERERLIPFVLKQFVREVNLDSRKIVVDWDADF